MTLQPVALDPAKIGDAMLAGCDGCHTCPFTISEAAEQAQNYGCLPSNFEVLAMAAQTGRPWGCHDDEQRVCRGYATVAKPLGLPITGEPLSYSRWYQGENPVGMTEQVLVLAGAGDVFPSYVLAQLRDLPVPLILVLRDYAERSQDVLLGDPHLPPGGLFGGVTDRMGRALSDLYPLDELCGYPARPRFGSFEGDGDPWFHSRLGHQIGPGRRSSFSRRALRDRGMA